MLIWPHTTLLWRNYGIIWLQFGVRHNYSCHLGSFMFAFWTWVFWAIKWQLCLLGPPEKSVWSHLWSTYLNTCDNVVNPLPIQSTFHPLVSKEKIEHNYLTRASFQEIIHFFFRCILGNAAFVPDFRNSVELKFSHLMWSALSIHLWQMIVPFALDKIGATWDELSNVSIFSNYRISYSCPSISSIVLISGKTDVAGLCYLWSRSSPLTLPTVIFWDFAPFIFTSFL